MELIESKIIMQHSPSGQTRVFSAGTDEEREAAAVSILSNLIASEDITEPTAPEMSESWRPYIDMSEDRVNSLNDEDRANYDYVQKHLYSKWMKYESDLHVFLNAELVSRGYNPRAQEWRRKQSESDALWSALLADVDPKEELLVDVWGAYKESTAWEALQWTPQWVSKQICFSVINPSL